MEEHAFLGLGDEEAEFKLAVGRLDAADILRVRWGYCQEKKNQPRMNTDESGAATVRERPAFGRTHPHGRGSD